MAAATVIDHAGFVKLSPSDKPEEVQVVTARVACMSVTVKNMLEDFGNSTDVVIPLHNISSAILQKVVAYCVYHDALAAQGAPAPAQQPTDPDKQKNDIAPWDVDYCNVDQSTLFELILAANYLDIKPLLDVTCKTVANSIKGKTPEQIRTLYNVKNDFTPEEEAKVRLENAWAEDA